MPPAYSNRPDPVARIRSALLTAVLAWSFMSLAAADPALAAGCAFEAQGEGRVAAVLDARSFRLDDGREIRLAGIEPIATGNADRGPALAAIVAGQQVKLSGPDDAPDRYGRQTAFAYLA